MTGHKFNDLRDYTDTEREETIDNKYLGNIGFERFFARQSDSDEALSEEKAIARVSEIRREKYKIIGPDGEKLAHLKGSTFYKRIFKPRSTLVLLGSSGVGKSSLVNTLSGKELMKVKEMREDDSKGRHTTTHRQLLIFEDGTMIIDTPGMRELELWDVSEGLGAAFSDIEMLSVECRFKDCKHLGEPGCAVQKAIKSGDLSRDRWNSYLKLKKEAEFAAAKESKNLLQQRKAKERSFGKMQKTFKKNGK